MRSTLRFERSSYIDSNDVARLIYVDDAHRAVFDKSHNHLGRSACRLVIGAVYKL